MVVMVVMVTPSCCVAARTPCPSAVLLALQNRDAGGLGLCPAARRDLFAARRSNRPVQPLFITTRTMGVWVAMARVELMAVERVAGTQTCPGRGVQVPTSAAATTAADGQIIRNTATARAAAAAPMRCLHRSPLTLTVPLTGTATEAGGSGVTAGRSPCVVVAVVVEQMHCRDKGMHGMQGPLVLAVLAVGGHEAMTVAVRLLVTSLICGLHSCEPSRNQTWASIPRPAHAHSSSSSSSSSGQGACHSSTCDLQMSLWCAMCPRTLTQR